ncbi:MAG: enoyl-CoA hydratase-related protein [SAR202 cluster bacterium]|nr:enoyl-CoA hydratase-related protein [SAR202 cluster bacterium]MDP7412552.1 enoyl-CoA hydratase-related protein [SAR202 cluster bacterium]
MAYENLKYEIDERVATITLNRPEKINALSWDMRQELYAALKAAERDQDVGCIVIKGNGRAFSAGYDLTPADPSPNQPPGGYVSPDLDKLTGQYARDLVNGWWVIWELAKPVVAQVHGWCLAGASELASMCDILFVADDAQLGYPPVRALSSPDTMYFPWKMPMSWAKYLMMTGKPVLGKDAVDIGWATKSFPADELDEAVRTEARAIATIPSDMLASNKKATNRAYEIMGIRTAMDVGVDWQVLSTYRNTAGEFGKISKEEGLRAALQWRDGPFKDYSARPRDDR